VGLPPAIRLPEERLQLVRGRLYEPRSGDFLSPDFLRFIESENPYRLGAVPRPLDPTRSWDELAKALRWIEEIENPVFKQHWNREQEKETPLSVLAALVRQPEQFEARLIERSFRYDFNPDLWFEPVAAISANGESAGLPRGLLAPPVSPADAFLDFSPIGPVPYDWPRSQSGEIPLP
jgi:hypothetical protein